MPAGTVPGAAALALRCGCRPCGAAAACRPLAALHLLLIRRLLLGIPLLSLKAFISIAV